MRKPRYLDAKRAAVRAAGDLNRGVRVPDYPLTLYLEVSNICNYKCAFCGSFSALNPWRLLTLKQADRGFFDLDAAGDNLDELIRHALTVYLFGFGEPTLHPQFTDLIRHVGEQETQVEFVTNGLGLDESLAQVLVGQRVRTVNISFSGATKSDYENVYLNGDFDAVIANISRLAALKREKKSRFPVISINSVAMRHHIAKLPEFVDLMAGAGANSIVVNGLMVFSAFPELYHHAAVFNPERDGALLAEARRRAAAHRMLLSTESFERLAASSPEEEQAVLRSRTSGDLPVADTIPNIPVGDIKAYAKGIGAERPGSNDLVAKTVAADADGAMAQLAIGAVPDMPHLHCYEPFRTAYVKRDGHVMPCCLWPEEQHSFGDLTKTPGHEIWNGPAFNLTRAAIIAGEYPRGCHFCVRSRAAPEDPQLWQATGFIEWYREGYGVDLREEFGSPNLISAALITSGLARADVPGWAQVATIAEKRYGWDQLGDIAHALAVGRAEISGYIEHANADGVFGWAYCPQYPNVSLPIEIVANGTVVGKAVALAPRKDLKSLGYGSGSYGFRAGVQVSLSHSVNLCFQVPGTDFRSAALKFGGAKRIFTQTRTWLSRMTLTRLSRSGGLCT
jgi:MoaA/NifB/PqqE/SkfB family radical SAM enzyme